MARVWVPQERAQQQLQHHHRQTQTVMKQQARLHPSPLQRVLLQLALAI